MCTGSAGPSQGRPCWERRVVRRQCPAANLFPPQGGLSASLPPWSLIIYRGDKIKQTQQNGAKPKRRSSPSRASQREEPSRVCCCLPASLSQQQSGGKPPLEQRRASGCYANGVISNVITATFILNAQCLFSAPGRTLISIRILA